MGKNIITVIQNRFSEIQLRLARLWAEYLRIKKSHFAFLCIGTVLECVVGIMGVVIWIPIMILWGVLMFLISFLKEYWYIPVCFALGIVILAYTRAAAVVGVMKLIRALLF